MRRSPVWTIVGAACMLACAAAGSVAQQAAVLRSTRDGVFTRAQARTGSDAYALLCRSCHTPGDHSATVKAKWSGRKLSDLFEYIGGEMPKNDPGTLQAGDIADILAFMLQTAGLPPGSEPLPMDAAAIARIQFDTAVTKSAPTGQGVKP